MEKIAIISDVHGNLEALKSVLEDIKKRNVNRIFCLGDSISKGTHSVECIELLKSSCEVMLVGNNEERFCKPDSFFDEEKLSKKRYKEMYEQLNEAERIYLGNLPFCYEFYLSGNLIRLLHSSPESTNDVINIFDKISTKRELFLPSSKTISNEIADIVIFGHVHVQILEKMYNRTIINPGSVGESAEIIRDDKFDAPDDATTNAHYIILEGEYGTKDNKSEIAIQFIRVPYDIDKELETSKELCPKYIKELKEGISNATEKIFETYAKRGIDLKNV